MAILGKGTTEPQCQDWGLFQSNEGSFQKVYSKWVISKSHDRGRCRLLTIIHHETCPLKSAAGDNATFSENSEFLNISALSGLRLNYPLS